MIFLGPVGVHSSYFLGILYEFTKMPCKSLAEHKAHTWCSRHDHFSLTLANPHLSIKNSVKGKKRNQMLDGTPLLMINVRGIHLCNYVLYILLKGNNRSKTESHTFLRAALGTQSWLLRGSPPRSGGSLHPLPAHISRGQWGDPRPAQQKVLRGHWNANSSS